MYVISGVGKVSRHGVVEGICSKIKHQVIQTLGFSAYFYLFPETSINQRLSENEITGKLCTRLVDRS